MTRSSDLETLESRKLLTGQFADVVDNPYFPLLPGAAYVYRGMNEDGESVRERSLVLADKRTVMGVACTVVRVREYENNDLVEDTRDFYAQDLAGNVWYFGEDSREIEDGEVVSRDGSWLAGVDGATPGIIMRSQLNIGDEYVQEGAPGVAEDAARVIGQSKNARTPFAAFGDCLQTEEFTPLEPDALEQKFYAHGIGFVLSRDVTGSSDVLRLASITLPPQAFDDLIDNPYFPLIPGTVYTYRGENEDGVSVRSRVNVLSDARVVAGVTCTVVRDRVFEDNELIEDTRDWYAQDLAGNVWYFGEDSRDIEDGEVVSREGSWEAGVNGATAGIIMRSQPGGGDAYQQEVAVGVAEDEARVIGFGNTIKTPFAKFGNCLRTEEFTNLEPGVLEAKFYAPGIGFIQSNPIDGDGEVLRLASITFV